jgi:glycosyltransferase involved in cell wall biosynthesis
VRICFVTLDFPPFRSSGLTIYAEKVARGLARRGHALTVVAAARPDSERAESIELAPGITVVRVPVGRADWLGLGWQAAHYLRSRAAEFDLIHFADIHFAYAHRGPFVATGHQSFRQRLSSHGGRTYHVNRRDYLFRTLYYNVARRAMEQPCARRAQHLIMVSGATRQEFVDHYHVAPSRTTVIYTGVDLGGFETLPERAMARQKLGLPSDAPVLLYVGFSTARKGLEYLARALRIMQSPAHLVMVGKWEKHYQRRFLRVLGSARARVHIAGYVPEADLMTGFAAADVFVLPSLLEGFGIPLVEAMAGGVPVVTTTAGAAGEIVGDAGLVVPPGDSPALAAALDRMLADHDLASQFSQIGQARARALFDERRMAADVEAVYQRVLSATL